ncbi:MAG: hypothetical protein ABIS18_04950 [Actinomycetota bacterium]
MRRTIVSLAMGLAMVFVPSAFAAGTQVVEGDVLVGNPGSAIGTGINENLGPSDADGIDGVWVTLDAVSTGAGETAGVIATDDSGLSDFDIWFYDADGRFIDDNTCAVDVDESCAVPAGAALAVVDLFLGAQGSFQFTYNY